MKTKTRQNIWLAVKILIGVFMCMPIIMAVLFSFQTNSQVANPPVEFFVKNPTLENYRFAFTEYNIPVLLRNTFIVLLLTIPAQVFISAISAYAFAHFEFPFKKALFIIALSAMLIPGETTFVTNFRTIQNMNLINTYWGIVIVGLVSITGVFMLRQHMLSLPPALWEAAKVDGCGDMRYFFSVVFPLSKAIILAFVLNGFIGCYNAYFWPLMVTNDENLFVMGIGVAQMIGDENTRTGYMLAGSVTSMIVPVVIYILGIDHIVTGMTAGAIKD